MTPTPDAFMLDLQDASALLGVLNYLTDAVVFIKDGQARYVYANDTLLRRLRKGSLAELSGCTSSDVFPAELGENYTRQDMSVLAGQALTEHLELHLYPGGQVGWCLTTKRALYRLNESGGLEISGLVGLSRDLRLTQPHLHELGQSLNYIQDHYAEQLTVQTLAAHAGMSVSTFERQVKRLYGLTPSQLLIRARIDAATRLLEQTDWPIARIAVECGYFDHSAFTRVFKSTVGLTPKAFRHLTAG